MKSKLAIIICLLAGVLLPAEMFGQAQIYTRKEKLKDITAKTTKVVLCGDEMLDEAMKESIAASWTMSPYEFCSMEEFEKIKTSDKFYATLGIKLPFFDSNKDNDLRNQVADLDAEGDYMAKARDVNVKVNRLVEQVNGYLAQWKVQKDFADKVKAGNIFEQFAKDAGSDPLLLLRARESALESELNAAKLEMTIYDLYLELLQYAGNLSKEGVQNHLVGGLK